MIDVDAEVLMPDGGTIKVGKIRGGGTIADWEGKPQMVKIRNFSKEKEFTILEFENGKTLYCLPYLSLLTWDDEIDARYLEPGDKVMGFVNGEKCEIAVAKTTRVTEVTKRRLNVPNKVKMIYFETYEDKPFVANEIVIGMRKQTGERKRKRSIKEFNRDMKQIQDISDLKKMLENK